MHPAEGEFDRVLDERRLMTRATERVWHPREGLGLCERTIYHDIGVLPTGSMQQHPVSKAEHLLGVEQMGRRDPSPDYPLGVGVAAACDAAATSGGRERGTRRPGGGTVSRIPRCR